MTTMTRHVGKLKNTGVRCIVVLRKMPGDAGTNVAEDREHALIVESEALPDMYHDNLMTVINSNEAQQTTELYSVLARRSFGDGNNMINIMHQRGFMKKVRVDDVVLYPMPNNPCPLRMVNDAIDGITTPTEETAPLASPAPESAAPAVSDGSAIARGLLVQADLLEVDAAAKREEAYTLDPTLRPKVGRPELAKEEKELRRIKRNEARRANYNAKKEA